LRRDGGYIGVVIDHNSSSRFEGEEEGEDNCPACEKAGYGCKLSRKIIYVEQTKRGPKISKNPITALGLDTDKQYRQCWECGNIYDLNDLPMTIMQDPEQEEINRAYREGDFIPGPGPGIKSKNKIKKLGGKLPPSKVKPAPSSVGADQDTRDKDKPKGKIIKQIQKVKIVKKNPVPAKGNS
jgi:hypothetical protein